MFLVFAPALQLYMEARAILAVLNALHATRT